MRVVVSSRIGPLAMSAVLLCVGQLLCPPDAVAVEDKGTKPPMVPAPSSAAPGTADPADLEILRQRAAKFWAARLAGDLTTEFELLEPRGRGRVTPAEYVRRGGAIKYLAYEVDEALPNRANQHFARVKVRLLVQPMVPSAPNRRIPPQVSVIGDRWVRVGGTWYRSFEQGDELGHGPSE